MKKSFKDKEDGAKEAEVNEAEVALVDGSSDVATQGNVAPLVIGGVSGDIDETDLRVPRLSLVHSVGDLSEEFTPGDLVISTSKLLLAHKNEPVNLIVLNIGKTYEETLPYDPDPNSPRPRVFNSRQEVLDAGLWTDWKNDQRPPVHPVADMTVLIEQPEGVDGSSFTKEILNKNYMMARWTVRKTAYTSSAKTVFSAAAAELASSGVEHGLWTLVIERQLKGGNWVFTPVLKLAGKSTPEFVGVMTALLG